MRMLRVTSALFVATIFSGGVALAATGATVTCKDGTSAAGGRGACRGHGGVDKSATAGSATSAPTAAREPEASASTVTCKDGATSKGGRGACRGHGGVAKAGEAAPAAPHASRTMPAVPPSGAAPSGSRTAPPVPPSGAPPSAPPRATAPTSQPRAATPPPAQVAATSHGKAASNDPTGAIARCKDGVYWHSTHHQGACSRHGGVESWTDQPR